MSEIFKNACKKHHCFIIGNGSSLNSTDLDLLQKEYTFGLNGIAVIFPKTKWRPTFFVGVNYYFDKKYPNLYEPMMLAIEEARHSFIWNEHAPIRDDVTPMNCTLGHLSSEEIDLSCWSDNPIEWVGKPGTSSFVALQIAVWLGFNPIYLLGFDGNYKPEINGDPNHIEGYPRPSTKPALDKYEEINLGHVKAHEIAKKICDRKGIKIFNATRNGHLNVYQRILLEEVV